MLPFTLITQPTYEDALHKLSPARDLELLVVYHGEIGLRDFLRRILHAAGYDEPGRQLHLLELSVNDPLDLTGLIRTLGVDRVLLFGYDLPSLGLHLRADNYQPVTVADVTYLFADSLEFISRTKENGDNRAAAALWTAIKSAFLRA
jgi:hypothetical protein